MWLKYNAAFTQKLNLKHSRLHQQQYSTTSSYRLHLVLDCFGNTKTILSLIVPLNQNTIHTRSK